MDKLKIHKFKVLGGILGILVFSGAVFGGYKFLRPKTVNAAEIIKKSLERILEKGTIYHHKALYYRLSLEPNQPEPTPTIYEIWDDQDFDHFKQEVIYPNGKRVIQVFDGDIRWDYNEEENTLRKDIYVYPDPAEKEVKHGERLDLVKTYRDLLDNGILKAYEGELEGRKVWQVIDERANTYWNTFYFDKETFMLLQQEKWEEKEGRKVQTEKLTYEIMESIPKKDLPGNFFSFNYLLPEETQVLERHFNTVSGYVEEDYYPVSEGKAEVILTPTPAIKMVDSQGYYTGKISPRVPYEGLKFLEIDVHNFQPLETRLEENDYHYQNAVMDGYTFVAEKGEDFEFIALEDRSSNPGSFIETELYGWGPTVIRMDTTIGWGVPASTRYFYVVKGKDFYGPNFIAPDGTTLNGSKYGKYTLKITQRK